MIQSTKLSDKDFNMANIQGATNILPSVITDVVTQSRGVAIPGGSRLAAIIGEGSTDEVIVSQANGGGKDGLNSSYTSTTGADGRHFQLSSFPLISNRTTLFKNGVSLVGLESLIDGNPFSNKYDYRIDISSGKVELQRAHLVDQGGSFYVPLSTNVGLGVINSLTLVDPNAPPETWSVRCVSVQRNPLNQPIQDTAKFIAIGSVSGAKLDANGNPIIWTANNNVVSNGILSFSIDETKVLSIATSPFREGDAFTIKVASGVLVRGDSLTANYIPSANLNDPVLMLGMDDVLKRHGTPSVSNNLSLGAQLAFDNGAPSILTVQAAPPMPRRTSYTLSDAVNSNSTSDDDFIFPLPVGVVPDFNSNIHFFVKNNSTNVETQILPNKLTYYTLDTPGHPTTDAFIMNNTPAPGGYSFFYTVKQSLATIASGFDGHIGRNLAFINKGVFGSSIAFDSTYAGKTLKVIDAQNVANIGTYTIDSVSGGQLYVTHGGFTDFTTQTSVAFQVIDASTDLPLASATDGSVTAILTTATATLASNALTGVDFSTISNILTRRIRINGTATNNGLYDITSYNPLLNTVTIEKSLVNESGLRYEVLDPSDTSDYVVINKNVVPNGNGLRITIVDAKEASFYDAGWAAALASLEVVECDIVVPLPKQTISAIFQNALTHCITMSNIRNKKERVLFCGAINGLTPSNLTGATLAAVEDIGVLEGIQGENITDILAGNIEDLANYSVADAFGNTFRCVYFYPDQIVVQAGTENVLIDGFYLASAAAGYLSGVIKIEEPLTNKVLTGFTILRNKQFSTFTLEQLASAGVTTVQPVSGGGRVVWGITTTQSGYPEEQEISIVFIRDRIAKFLRSGFAGFIGTAESPDTQAILNTRAVQLLNSLASQGLLTAYKDLVVKKDDVDPRQWNITVRVQPTYPVNFIYIKVSLGQL
jgi:hypothetical protein